MKRNFVAFASAYASEKFAFVCCSFARKTTNLCLIFYIYLVFCKKAMEHQVTDKYLMAMGAEIFRGKGL
jgi:hypothetical protein